MPSALAALIALLAAGWSPSPAAIAKLDAGEAVAEVTPDGGPRAIVVRGAVDIAAPVDRISPIIADCAQAMRLLPFVKACRVLESGPDWDVREHVIDYGLFAPRIRARFRSDYLPGGEVAFRCVEGGELKTCEGAWRITEMGGVRRVTYENHLVLPFSAPMGLVRSLLGRDVRKGFAGLRRTALAAPAP